MKKLCVSGNEWSPINRVSRSGKKFFLLEYFLLCNLCTCRNTFCPLERLSIILLEKNRIKHLGSGPFLKERSGYRKHKLFAISLNYFMPFGHASICPPMTKKSDQVEIHWTIIYFFKSLFTYVNQPHSTCNLPLWAHKPSLFVPRRNQLQKGDIGFPFVCPSVRPSICLEFTIYLSITALSDRDTLALWVCSYCL